MDARQTAQRIKENVKMFFYDKTGDPSDLLRLMTPEGAFSDLDYQDQNWTTWAPDVHAKRILALAQIYTCPENLHYKDRKIETAIHQLIDYFINGHFVSDNWWMNEVGIPKRFVGILFLGDDLLSNSERKAVEKLAAGVPEKPRAFKLLKTTKPGNLRNYPSQSCHMLSQVVDSVTELAAMEQNDERFLEAIQTYIDAVSHELCVITYAAGHSPSHLYCEEHSIKTDYSYHEHENGVLPNTYGDWFLEELNLFLRFISGTALRLSAAAERELARLLTEGFRYMRFHGVSPMSVLGRDAGSYDEPDYYKLKNKIAIDGICTYLKEHGEYVENPAAIEECMQCVEPSCDRPHFKGTKYFWHSDFLSHNRKGYQCTVFAASKHIKRPEAALDKNRCGLFLGDGCMNIMQSGAEYNGLQPYLDWHKIPGTTVNQSVENLDPESEIDTKADPARIFGAAKGNSDFTGGISDGEYGLFAFDYNRFEVQAKKTWFCLDDRIICLGAHIRTGAAGAFTTVNQCHTSGFITVDGKPFLEEKKEHGQVKTVLHERIGYLFLDDNKNIYLENAVKTGAWSRIDKASGPDTPISGRVFTLGMTHKPYQTNGSYAYVVLPECDAEKLESVCQAPEITVLANNEGCQAVQAGGVLFVVFYKAGKLVCRDLTISVSAPCLLMLTEKGEGYRLHATEPHRAEGVITVQLSGRIQEEVSFVFRSGFRSNDLGRALCYDSAAGFVVLQKVQGEI